MALAVAASLPTARYRRLLSTLVLSFVIATIIITYSRLTGSLLPSEIRSIFPLDGSILPADGPMALYHVDAARPPLHGLPTILGTLDPKHIPVAGNGRRLIIVGDVHGMIDPLNELLDKVNYRRPGSTHLEEGPETTVDRRDDDFLDNLGDTPDDGSDNTAQDEAHPTNTDHLIFVGDMINKGPSSAAVVKLAMKLGASAVRGNHEDRILLERQSMRVTRAGDDDTTTTGDSGADAHDSLDAQPEQQVLSSPLQRGNPGDRKCARSLSDAQAAWLAALPAILDLGPLEGCFPGSGRVVVAHAGVVPNGAPLEAQNPWAVMNMRSVLFPREELRREEALSALIAIAAAEFRKSEEYLSNKKHWTEHRIRKKLRPTIPDEAIEAEFRRRTKPSDRDVVVPHDGRAGLPWADVWADVQRAIPEEARRTAVVYGHDSKLGLRQGPFSIGLDSRCVRGGELSALVVEATADGLRHSIVSVSCKEPKAAGPDVYGDGEDGEDRP